MELLRLYRYLTADSALRTLQGGKLKLGFVSKFNDPFDSIFGVGPELEAYPDDVAQAREGMLRGWDQYYGILCFAELRDDPLMWAHYAENHRGMVLEFDFPLLPEAGYQLVKVKYRKNIPRITMSAMRNAGAKVNVSFLRRLVSTKSHHWKYEKERRLLVSLEDESVTASGDHHFVPLINLRGVVLGQRCETTADEVREMLADGPFKGVPIYKTHISMSRFQLDIEEEPSSC